MSRPPLRSIIYVEDSPNIRAVAQIALESVGGLKLYAYDSGAEALAAVEAGVTADLLLLDVMLPGMDGPTILERMRRLPATETIPVVFMTAKAQQTELAYYQSLGALGVIPKPFDPMLLATQIQKLWHHEPPRQRDGKLIQDRLRVFKTQFIEGLPKQMDALTLALQQCLLAGATPGHLTTLHQLLHGLSGTAGTFGFDELGNRARAIEVLINARQAGGDAPDAEFGEIAGALKNFLSWAASVTDKNVIEASHEPEPLHHVADTVITNRLVYLVDGDALSAHEMATQLGHFGFQVTTLAHVRQLAAAIEREIPSAIVMDLPFQDDVLDGCAEIAQLRQARPDLCPVIVISTHGEFSTRLAAVNAGVDGYLVKPVDTTLLSERLSELTKQRGVQPYRIMIVDDDIATAEYYGSVLQEAGMDAAVLYKPEDVLHMLEKYRPELIVMDLYMPDCSGTHLAKLIRQVKMYLDVPIVFLSSEHNLDRQIDAIQSGADYFLTKPITPARLISSLSSRAERYRSLRGLIMRDSLTGLYNHSAIKEHLSREIARATRSKTPLAIAMIDLDFFKNVNDTYGHPIGDQVIRALARVMQQRLRQGDFIGRYGGEEFTAILPGTSAASALLVLEEVREAFSRIQHRTGDSKFTATFSAGIASLEGHGDMDALLHAADAALYRAKEKGRNCVEVS